MVHEDRGDFEMKVKGIESAHSVARGRWSVAGDRQSQISDFKSQIHRPLLAILFLVVLAVAAVPPASSAFSDDKDDKQKEIKEKILREARKVARDGKYEKAIGIYRGLLDKDAQDVQARLGLSLAYLKVQDYLHSFEHAAETIKIDPNNARAHALVGTALLRSGLV